MKLFKALSRTIQSILSVVDNITAGTNELSLMYKDVCESARKEQALDSLKDLKDLAKANGVTAAELKELTSSTSTT